MPSKPKLSVLVATTGQRHGRFHQLLDYLMPQVSGQPVEVVAYWNNGELPVGDIRQALVDEAKGDYVCFVDDDDRVPPYYIEEILKAIKKKPDYVGFQLQLYQNGELAKPTFHSLKYDKWWDDDNGYYRNTSHLNPIRRTLALKVPFRSEVEIAEDVPWAEKIAPHVKTEVYIDKIMYYYQHSNDDSTWRGVEPKRDYIRSPRSEPEFRYHPASKQVFQDGTKKTAVLVVDIFNDHWDSETKKLLKEGYPHRVSVFLKERRENGAVIIHAPSACAVNYHRPYIPIDTRYWEIKSPAPVFTVPAPDIYHKPWTGQHPDIPLHPGDYLSDSASEIFSLLKIKNVETVYVVGLHLDVCIVNNNFGVQNLIKYGFKPIIVEDLVETLYTPREEALGVLRPMFTLKGTGDIRGS